MSSVLMYFIPSRWRIKIGSWFLVPGSIFEASPTGNKEPGTVNRPIILFFRQKNFILSPRFAEFDGYMIRIQGVYCDANI